MSFEQFSHGSVSGAKAQRAEACVALVPDECIVAQDMAIPGRGGAHAPVVLLAVAAPEGDFVEHADSIYTGTPHIHAEPDRGRNLRVARFGRLTAGEGPGFGIFRHLRRVTEQRQRGDLTVVRERRYRG